MKGIVAAALVAGVLAGGAARADHCAGSIKLFQRVVAGVVESPTVEAAAQGCRIGDAPDTSWIVPGATHYLVRSASPAVPLSGKVEFAGTTTQLSFRAVTLANFTYYEAGWYPLAPADALLGGTFRITICRPQCDTLSYRTIGTL